MTTTTEEVNRPALVAVNFHGDEIVTFEREGTPYVAMRRIVENLGIDWSRQRQKLEEQTAKFSCGLMSTTGADGKTYQMLSMPVAKLPLWLASINPARIKDADKRAKVELYQERSAQALHDYWTRGVAIRDDMAGVMEEIGPDARKVLGGIVKGIVHKEFSEIIPQLVQEAVLSSRFGTTRDYLTAGQALDLAKVPPKGRRGLVNKAAASLRKFCEREGQVPREAFLGNSARAYVYHADMVQRWLAAEGKAMIRKWEDETGKQRVLKLVN